MKTYMRIQYNSPYDTISIRGAGMIPHCWNIPAYRVVVMLDNVMATPGYIKHTIYNYGGLHSIMSEHPFMSIDVWKHENERHSSDLGYYLEAHDCGHNYSNANISAEQFNVKVGG